MDPRADARGRARPYRRSVQSPRDDVHRDHHAALVVRLHVDLGRARHLRAPRHGTPPVRVRPSRGRGGRRRIRRLRHEDAKRRHVQDLAALVGGRDRRRVGRRHLLARRAGPQDVRALAWIALASAVAFVPDGRAIRHDVTADDGHRIAVWEKHASPENAVILLIHGRTWSSLPNFDLDVPGERRSVMDAFVASGLTAYAIDLRGYGATPRDASGCLSPDRAVADVKAVTDWIAQNDGRGGRARRPAILGLSRGALVAASFAQQYPDRVSALVLLGFGYDPDVRFQRTPDAASSRRP
ncbi:MAG: hypothetical protein DMF85_05835 [Acidobacteria bacterium]|nr:MAG: hypothetical protein DMF85_05835 [Acidobacteriota bacterium]